MILYNDFTDLVFHKDEYQMQLWKERMRGIHRLGAAAIAGHWSLDSWLSC